MPKRGWYGTDSGAAAPTPQALAQQRTAEAAQGAGRGPRRDAASFRPQRVPNKAPPSILAEKPQTSTNTT
ncbi:hypothetical protein [Streptomyces sp. NPDC102360]|uniref:hypothetical protein n=1 Tax=Streptomyces sp. NPDC102360 TaxID=3366160 RepID=UPI0038276D43